MTSSRYLLVYDAKNSTLTEEVVSAFIKSNKYILQWARPFSGAFLIKSANELVDLIESFRGFFGSDFLVVKIENTHKDVWNGRMPSEFWRWFSLLNGDDNQILELK